VSPNIHFVETESVEPDIFIQADEVQNIVADGADYGICAIEHKVILVVDTQEQHNHAHAFDDNAADGDIFEVFHSAEEPRTTDGRKNYAGRQQKKQWDICFYFVHSEAYHDYGDIPQKVKQKIESDDFRGGATEFDHVVTHTGYFPDGIKRNSQPGEQYHVVDDRGIELHLPDTIGHDDTRCVWESDKWKQQACHRIEQIVYEVGSDGAYHNLSYQFKCET